MSSCAFSSDIYLVIWPPTSLERESFPSENAPAPDQPHMMAQGLQPTHFPVVRAGQTRLSMLRPASTSRIFVPGASFVSSSAVKMPAGPAPMMITSYWVLCVMGVPPFRRRSALNSLRPAAFCFVFYWNEQFFAEFFCRIFCTFFRHRGLLYPPFPFLSTEVFQNLRIFSFSVS